VRKKEDILRDLASGVLNMDEKLAVETTYEALEPGTDACERCVFVR